MPEFEVTLRRRAQGRPQTLDTVVLVVDAPDAEAAKAMAEQRHYGYRATGAHPGAAGEPAGGTSARVASTSA